MSTSPLRHTPTRSIPSIKYSVLDQRRDARGRQRLATGELQQLDDAKTVDHFAAQLLDQLTTGDESATLELCEEGEQT